MRNLIQYPVSKAEIIECLMRLSNEISERELCGDMRPTLLEAAASIVGHSTCALDYLGQVIEHKE